jgi:hypothetical protein
VLISFGIDALLAGKRRKSRKKLQGGAFFLTERIGPKFHSEYIPGKAPRREGWAGSIERINEAFQTVFVPMEAVSGIGFGSMCKCRGIWLQASAIFSR